ncbi:LysM peptidoglycan-binding domain-containing protein [Solidesulfovibrio carbinolicus]|uniref:Peptidoglycan-binding protein n=1 Tax=Solidesulfovibrio carbinolicus TaxID=296842 RepID=A0A4P6HK37_9BACT|nr:LysM peptidoglycan-binding domain-containing protein [Solidesulfovibrio carbinolicus]QAZ67573.1 peptidoglycan-binding protein [Solidesulfovibrio carbinolicus]
MRSVIALVALGLIALVSACSGGDKESFRHVDHDKNGKISYEELLFVFPDVTPDLFTKSDADFDGGLSESEYAAFLTDDARLAAKTAAPAPNAPSPVRPGDGKQLAVPFKGEEVIEIPAPVAEPAVKAKPEKGKKEKDAKETKDAKGKSDGGKKSEGTTYTVQRGDHLSRIAHKFGVSVEDITRANGDMHPDTLRDGQVLNIPAKP